MRNYFEEMNIDYNELKRYEDIETYYDEVEDYTKLIKELQCDRVEALKQIVNKNREIERLNNIIEELKKDSEAFKKFNAWVVNRIEPDWFHKFDLIKKLEELKGDDKE